MREGYQTITIVMEDELYKIIKELAHKDMRLTRNEIVYLLQESMIAKGLIDKEDKTHAPYFEKNANHIIV